eukprot:9425865-Alexandrium_andersonii.AAC.1
MCIRDSASTSGQAARSGRSQDADMSPAMQPRCWDGSEQRWGAGAEHELDATGADGVGPIARWDN